MTRASSSPPVTVCDCARRWPNEAACNEDGAGERPDDGRCGPGRCGPRGGDALAIDGLVASLPTPIPADLVAPLLETLVDRHEHEEVLWSIVHAAETVPTGPYERGLLTALPNLWRTASEWAQVLLLRCMNFEASLRALLSALAQAAQLSEIRWVLSPSRKAPRPGPILGSGRRDRVHTDLGVTATA